MATALDPKQVVSFEALLMSQVVQQEAITNEQDAEAKKTYQARLQLYRAGFPYHENQSK